MSDWDFDGDEDHADTLLEAAALFGPWPVTLAVAVVMLICWLGSGS